MSIEQLRIDMKESAGELAKMSALTITPDLIKFLQHTLWPTLEAIVNETAAVDACVEELYEQQDDALQPETAQVFAALIVTGRQIAAELRARLAPGEDALRKALDGYEEIAKACEETINEITLPDPGDDDDDEDDDEGAK